MRAFMIILLFPAILACGCYVVEYRYDPYHDGYYGSSGYCDSPSVRYYSPVEPLVDLAILGAAIYTWNHWQPRRCYAPPSRYSRIRR